MRRAAASAASALRVQLLRRFGADGQVLREAFDIVDGRADVRPLGRLLAGPGARLRDWRRSWRTEAKDPGKLWEAASHSAPDARTPLMSALLATPRHVLLARARASPKGAAELRRLARREPGTLAGRTANALPHGGAGPLGASALEAAAGWRVDAASALLDAAAGAGGSAGSRDALVAAVDHAGRSALHYAAGAGDAAVCARLLDLGAKPDVADIFGRLPAHAAAAGGGERTLVEDLLSAAGPCAASTGDAQGHTADWLLERRAGGDQEVEVTRSMSWAALFGDYAGAGRPVLVKGGAAHLPACQEWQDGKGLERAIGGDLQLAVGTVPYSPDGTTTTIRDFLDSEATAGAQSGTGRRYVFDVTAGRRSPGVLKAANILPRSVCEQHVAYLRHPQLGIGFQGAGAPMHMHHPALNALFVGRKRWLLARPSASFWSMRPSAEFFGSEECEQLRSSGDLLEFVQEAGDLVFVPEGWGHATLLEEYCVGVGQEFIPLASLSS